MKLSNPSRMLKFAVVGASGVVVNTAFLWLFTEVVRIHYMVSSPMAVEIAVLSNFMFNNYWTFRDAVGTSPFTRRLIRFHIAAFGGFVINYAFLVGLTELAELYYLVSNLAGILAAFLWNYAINVKWTWGSAG